MKIAIIAPPKYPVSFQTGTSVEICIYQISKRLAVNHCVTIFSKLDKQHQKNNIDRNLKIKSIPSNSNLYLKNIIKVLKKENYDLIQIENRPLYSLSLRKHFPEQKILLSLHSLTFMSYLSTKVQEDIIRKVDIIVCNSNYIKNFYSTQFPKYKNKFKKIYLGVDLKQFRPPNLEEKELIRNKYNLPNTHTILYIGRIIPMKGIDILLKATQIIKKSFPQSTLVLVGHCSKSYKNKLLKIAEKRGVTIHFIGNMPAEMVHLGYWLGDVFVIPTKFNEAFGLVNLEAMASSIPVIASKRGGIPEVIKNGIGDLVVDYENPHSYADVIKRRFDDMYFNGAKITNSMTKKALENIKQYFQWENTVENYEVLLRELEMELLEK